MLSIASNPMPGVCLHVSRRCVTYNTVTTFFWSWATSYLCRQCRHCQLRLSALLCHDMLVSCSPSHVTLGCSNPDVWIQLNMCVRVQVSTEVLRWSVAPGLLTQSRWQMDGAWRQTSGPLEFHPEDLVKSSLSCRYAIQLNMNRILMIAAIC